MKSYTDLEQSKRLAEILPLESASMIYMPIKGGFFGIPECYPFNEFKDSDTKPLPCWSLAELIGMLRVFTTPTAFSVKVSTPSLIKTENGYKLTYIGDYTPMINNGLDIEAPIEITADNPVDACVAMIEKLHEEKLL